MNFENIVSKTNHGNIHNGWWKFETIGADFSCASVSCLNRHSFYREVHIYWWKDGKEYNTRNNKYTGQTSRVHKFIFFLTRATSWKLKNPMGNYCWGIYTRDGKGRLWNNPSMINMHINPQQSRNKRLCAAHHRKCKIQLKTLIASSYQSHFFF